MRRLLFIAAVVLSSLLLFTACNSTPSVNYINFSSENYQVVCNNDNFSESILVDEFNDAIEEKTGRALSKVNYVHSKPSEYEIIFGRITTRAEYTAAAEKMSQYATGDVGVWCVKVVDKKLVIAASNDKSLSLAVNYAKEFITSEGLLIEENTDKLVVFDYTKYITTGDIVTYTDEELARISTVSSIAVGDKTLSDFSRDVFEYTAETDFLTGYPTVAALASAKGATLTVTQATYENGGIATVTVESKDKSTKSSYKVVFNVNNEYAVNAQVVNKDGASSAIVFTIDDGDTRTASFMYDEMMPKYPHLRATFALVTNKIATLKTNGASGTESYEWALDDDGRYVYEVKQTAYEFWKKIAESGKFALTSHSHTHSYMGDDDGGGVFEYKKSDGTPMTSKYFPKGNVTMELSASMQIIKDLFPSQSVLGYIKPGTGAVHSDYYYDKIINGGEYISARSTAGNYNNPATMVNTSEWLATWRNRYYVKGYMVQHYTTNADILTDQSSTPEECLAVGIPAWKNYIDEAVKAGGMACFCIHTIREDDHTGTGHYIYDTQADQLFDYANTLAERGDAWVAFYDEAMIYYNEWSTSTVTASAFRDEKITVTMTHKEVGDMYSVPLTVKVALPSGWSAAKIDGEAVTVHTDNDGGKFVYVNVLMGENTVIENVK